ncbi:MAG: hypothetical protein SXA11_08310 [Cyanobacteriota bacterium]|nr:hypothetical protein [Cyanobacteriota bacterium]
MNSEQVLLDKWRTLPLEKQRQVWDFIREIERTNPTLNGEGEGTYKPKTELGKKLWEIRCRSLADKPKLLTWDEIDEEISDIRGGRG